MASRIERKREALLAVTRKIIMLLNEQCSCQLAPCLKSMCAADAAARAVDGVWTKGCAEALLPSLLFIG